MQGALLPKVPFLMLEVPHNTDIICDRWQCQRDTFQKVNVIQWRLVTNIFQNIFFCYMRGINDENSFFKVNIPLTSCNVLYVTFLYSTMLKPSRMYVKPQKVLDLVPLSTDQWLLPSIPKDQKSEQDLLRAWVFNLAVSILESHA